VDQTTAARIQAIGADKPASTISKIRALYPYIEQAKHKHVSHGALVSTLNECGIRVTVKSLSRMLMQIRRELGSLPPAKARTAAKAPGSPSSARSKPKDLEQSLPARKQHEQTAEQFIKPSVPNTLIQALGELE
jgi:hypothetical protein